MVSPFKTIAVLCFIVFPELFISCFEAQPRLEKRSIDNPTWGKQIAEFKPFPVDAAPPPLRTFGYKAEVSRQIANDFSGFIRSVIPSLQPKFDFAADVITGLMDAQRGKILQTFENTNNTIVAVENVFKLLHHHLIGNVNNGTGALRQRGSKNLPRMKRRENNKSIG